MDMIFLLRKIKISTVAVFVILTFLSFLITAVFAAGTIVNAQVGSRCGEGYSPPGIYSKYVCASDNMVKSLSCRADNDKCEIIRQQHKQANDVCQKIVAPHLDLTGCNNACFDNAYRCTLLCPNIPVYQSLACSDACDVTEETCEQNCKNSWDQFSACDKDTIPLYDKYEQCLKELYWLPVLEPQKEASACPSGFICVSDPKYGPSCKEIVEGTGAVTTPTPPVENASKEQDEPRVSAGEPGALPEKPTLLEQAKTLDGDPLRDFLYDLSLDELEELFTEKNRENIGVPQWVKLVKASEDIRQLKRNAMDLGQRDVDELGLYLDSNDLAPWERAVLTEVIERIKNKPAARPSLAERPDEDFFPEPSGVGDYQSKSRVDYAREVERRNEEADRRNDIAEQEYRKIIDALNLELGVSPLRQGFLDQERAEREAAAELYKPDPTYTGVDFEVPYDSANDQDTAVPFVSGRGRNPVPDYTPPPQSARIADYQGRVVVERTERDGTKTYEQVRRIGTSMRPAVIFEGDRVFVGQDSSVDIVKPNGSWNRYAAPDLPEHPTGDDINADVQNTVIRPPDPKTPPLHPILERIQNFFNGLIPAPDPWPSYGGGVKG